jgi:hypothetical protein
VSGTWDFADTTNPSAGSTCVSLTSGDDLDAATFSDGTETAMSGFTTITGQIRLETYSGITNSILLQFQNNGSDVGTSVNLNGHIDTALLGSYQGFAIPKGDFNITTETVDEIDMTVTRAGGSKPTFRFDTWQIEETGTPATFVYRPTLEQTVKLIAIKVVFADNVTATSSYNAFLGVSALANGITVTAQSVGKSVFSGTFQRLIDFLQIPNSQFATQVGAADTWMTVNIQFDDNHVILNAVDEDNITFTIVDNLSGLTFFRAFVMATERIA